MGKWNNIVSKKEIDDLMNRYGCFEDSFIIRFEYVSGNYVDDDLTAHEYDTHSLSVIFQRMERNPFSIEILFEFTSRINLYLPIPGDNYLADIEYAKIINDDKYYYWTTWKDFDPFNPEHMQYNDFTLIQAKNIKWRVVIN